MTPFFDLHTHHRAAAKGLVNIFNMHADFDTIACDAPVSMGLHPWYLDAKTLSMQFESLQAAAKKDKVLAIGECGLDKLCKTSMDLQKFCFTQQIRLAKELHKPLVIHCVRAFEEVLQILRKETVSVPVIFHNFRKGIILAQKILSAGYQLSFSHHLSQSPLADIFKSIPAGQLFLETDDGAHSIMDIYAAAASVRNIDTSLLKEQIWANARLIFGERIQQYE